MSGGIDVMYDFKSVILRDPVFREVNKRKIRFVLESDF